MSENELELLKATRSTLYDEKVPLGAVVARCCRNVLADNEDGGIRY
jgi:hypothetical protein